MLDSLELTSLWLLFCFFAFLGELKNDLRVVLEVSLCVVVHAVEVLATDDPAIEPAADNDWIEADADCERNENEADVDCGGIETEASADWEGNESEAELDFGGIETEADADCVDVEIILPVDVHNAWIELAVRG